MLYLPLSMLESETTQVATKVCSKDTVSEAGLNVWVTGEHNGNAPSVEYDAVRCGAPPASLTVVEA